MKTRNHLIWLILAIMVCSSLLLGGCLQRATTTPVAQAPTSAPLATATVAPTGVATATVASLPTLSDPRREIIVIHTSDEHGVLRAEIDNGFANGGAELAASDWLSRSFEPADQNSNVLLLSGGDNWMGPAISTWFQGESTIETMNAMGYRASVLGNHEFDQGQDVLRQRIEQAQFPFLAANVFDSKNGVISDLAQPYLLMTINDVKIGIIGLALQSTPRVTAAKQLEGLRFGDYEQALRKWVPVVRERGAQIVIAETHICPRDLALLAASVKDLDIDLFQGGHCHESRLTRAGDALVATGTAYWQDYVLTRFVYDLEQGQVVQQEQELIDVFYVDSKIPPVNEQVTQIVAKWDAKAQAVLGQEIGYTQRGLGQHSVQMYNLLVDSWLWAFDSADVAISNTGGFRQDISPGAITLGDVIGVFPFDNVIYQLEISGKDLIAAVRQGGTGIVIGGMEISSGGRLSLTSTGKPVDPQGTYTLLTTDYMYNNSKYGLKSTDNAPYDTSLQWRDPVVDWIKAQGSTKSRPIEKMIDSKPRY